jgi:hypothetical protein
VYILLDDSVSTVSVGFRKMIPVGYVIVAMGSWFSKRINLSGSSTTSGTTTSSSDGDYVGDDTSSTTEPTESSLSTVSSLTPESSLVPESSESRGSGPYRIIAWSELISYTSGCSPKPGIRCGINVSTMLDRPIHITGRKFFLRFSNGLIVSQVTCDCVLSSAISPPAAGGAAAAAAAAAAADPSDHRCIRDVVPELDDTYISQRYTLMEYCIPAIIGGDVIWRDLSSLVINVTFVSDEYDHDDRHDSNYSLIAYVNVFCVEKRVTTTNNDEVE